jgi:phosphate transport system protein
MQTFFELELDRLRKRLIKMFNLVNSQLEKSFRVLLKGDTEYFEMIRQDENKIDKLDIKIDKLCQRIFALAQPVAGDLRFIMAALRIGNEMERISDMTFGITRRSETVSRYPKILKKYGIPGLLEQIRKSFSQTTESFNNRNSELAFRIIEDCKDMDEKCKKIFRVIVSDMTKKSGVIVIATDLILIMRNLERIAGHIENIAESIIFIIDAKIIRHSGLKSKDHEDYKPGTEN